MRTTITIIVLLCGAFILWRVGRHSAVVTSTVRVSLQPVNPGEEPTLCIQVEDLSPLNALVSNQFETVLRRCRAPRTALWLRLMDTNITGRFIFYIEAAATNSNEREVVFQDGILTEVSVKTTP